ncbi:MAG: M15 family metallopeptidase [Acetatifactor sp.]
MNQDKQKLIRMFVILAAIVLLVGGLTKLFKSNSQSLSDYAALHPELNLSTDESEDTDISLELPEASTSESTGEESSDAFVSLPIGASLNGDSQLEHRVVYTDSFYYEPLSDNLRRFITGVSFPQTDENSKAPEITYDELCYLHILHYNFDGEPTEGELICNKTIAQDLVEIFYELYCNEYRLEKVRLIDEYDGDDTASMEDNNTSCFNYRTVPDSASISKHAYGLAVDVNPLYNPYITYGADGREQVAPENGQAYADRSKSFPYKIDEDDLCYKLFTKHGFIWGGNWNSCKDYQHFQKTK